MNIDEKDLKILKELENNSKQTMKMISRKHKISLTTVYDRIKKLEKSGVIKGYTAIVDYEKLGYGLPVFIEIKVKTDKQISFIRKITDHPKVSNIFGVTGDVDLVLECYFKNKTELVDFIRELVSIEGVIKTNTRIILDKINRHQKMNWPKEK
jgi:DNA-binding Lrp family transcriptional regulator